MDLVASLPRVALDGPDPVPLLGAVPNVLRFFRDPVGHLTRLHARYGDVVPLTRGDATWVAVRGREALRQTLSDARAFHNLADSPVRVPQGSAPDVLLGKALTGLNGEAHRRARRLMQPLFSRTAVTGYHDEMNAAVARAVGSWRVGERDVAQLTLELALEVAMRSLYGVEPGVEAAEIGRLSQRFLEGLLDPLVLLAPLDVRGAPYARWMRDCERYEGLLRRMIAERRARPDGRPDVLSTLLRARDDDASQLSETELVAHGAVLLTASHETTANTLAWTLLLLAAHPQAYARVEAELADTLRGEPPTPAQLASLPELDRVVKESQRLLPASCILFFRAAQEPFSLAGHALPAGTRLLMSPLHAHRDPALYPEPQRFEPQRWATLEPSPYEYLPFGAGPRLCIGAQFASQAVRLALAAMLQRFRFELPYGTRVDRHVRGITLGPGGALPMLLSRPGGPFRSPPPLAGDLHELVDGLPRA